MIINDDLKAVLEEAAKLSEENTTFFMNTNPKSDSYKFSTSDDEENYDVVIPKVMLNDEEIEKTDEILREYDQYMIEVIVVFEDDVFLVTDYYEDTTIMEFKCQ